MINAILVDKYDNFKKQKTTELKKKFKRSLEECKHTCAINAMINEVIDGVSILITAGVDKLINIWNVDYNGVKKAHFIKNIETNNEHTESVNTSNNSIFNPTLNHNY